MLLKWTLALLFCAAGFAQVWPIQAGLYQISGNGQNLVIEPVVLDATVILARDATVASSKLRVISNVAIPPKLTQVNPVAATLATAAGAPADTWCVAGTPSSLIVAVTSLIASAGATQYRLLLLKPGTWDTTAASACPGMLPITIGGLAAGETRMGVYVGLATP